MESLYTMTKSRFNILNANSKRPFSPCWDFSLTQFDESNHGFVMDLASAVWVIDRTIGVEMGVGTQQGLPQGRFYYFQAEEGKKEESLPLII